MHNIKENFLYWGNNSGDYFDISEQVAHQQWDEIIIPFLLSGYLIDILWLRKPSLCVDLACGRGRWTNMLKNLFDEVYAIDVNKENFDYCVERFKNDKKVSVFINDGYKIPILPDDSMDFIFSFDAMVHFDIDVIVSYLQETQRVLRKGGLAFFHHSNYPKHTEDIKENPHWRNNMTKELFAVCAKNEGLEVVKQQVIDWGGVKNLDCLTLLRK